MPKANFQLILELSDGELHGHMIIGDTDFQIVGCAVPKYRPTKKAKASAAVQTDLFTGETDEPSRSGERKCDLG